MSGVFDWSRESSENQYLNGDEEVVDDGMECPRRSEFLMDRMVFDADGETVTCASCGAEYDPGEKNA